MIAAPAGDGALVGWVASKDEFGMQFLHVDHHGTEDEPLPPVVPAPYLDRQFQIAFALTNSHGHLGVARYEETLGFAFTPVDVHGVTMGPEVQVAPDPGDAFAHQVGLYATPTGFLEMDRWGTNITLGTELDFTGAAQSRVSPVSALPADVFSDATVLDDATVIGFGVGHDAPAITDQAGGVMQVLDANAESVFPSLFVANVGDVPWVTVGVASGMSVVELRADGSPASAPASFTPADGNCTAVAYAHGSVLCVTPRTEALDVQAFGFDGTPHTPVLTAAFRPPDAPITLATTLVVPTSTGALVFLEPPVDGRPVVYSFELSCAP